MFSPRAKPGKDIKAQSHTHRAKSAGQRSSTKLRYLPRYKTQYARLPTKKSLPFSRRHNGNAYICRLSVQGILPPAEQNMTDKTQ